MGDLLLMLVFRSNLMKSQGKLYNQYLIHHVFSIVLFPYALLCSRATLYIVFTELTNPVTNAIWIMGNRPGWSPSPFFYGLGIFLSLQFFFIRILPAPILLGAWLYTDNWFNGQLNLLEGIVIVGALWIPFFLNMFWFKLLTRKVYRGIKAVFTNSGSKDDLKPDLEGPRASSKKDK